MVLLCSVTASVPNLIIDYHHSVEIFVPSFQFLFQAWWSIYSMTSFFGNKGNKGRLECTHKDLLGYLPLSYAERFALRERAEFWVQLGVVMHCDIFGAFILRLLLFTSYVLLTLWGSADIKFQFKITLHLIFIIPLVTWFWVHGGISHFKHSLLRSTLDLIGIFFFYVYQCELYSPWRHFLWYF